MMTCQHFSYRNTRGVTATERGERASGCKLQKEVKQERVCEWAVSADGRGPLHREKTGRARGETMPTERPHRVEGEREWRHVSAGWRRQAGSTCQREAAGARTGLVRAGPNGLSWAEMGFPFFSFEFPIPFLFIFSIEFKSNQSTNSNSNTSNMCINQKQSLSSA